MKNSRGVSVITVTNSDVFIKNILENFSRQKHEKKELILVLNKNSLEKTKYEKEAKKHSNVRVIKLDEKISLGQCLNYAVKISCYNILAKFDDDDYYGPRYITDSLKYFKTTDADVIGKRSHLVYFENNKVLAIRNPNHENKYDSFVNGSSLIFKKSIFKKIKFANISIAEDTQFCNDCIKKGIKIYSTNRFHHVYIRRSSKKYHSWKINDKDFLKNSCKVIGQIEDYKNYADRGSFYEMDN